MVAGACSDLWISRCLVWAIFQRSRGRLKKGLSSIRGDPPPLSPAQRERLVEGFEDAFFSWGLLDFAVYCECCTGKKVLVGGRCLRSEDEFGDG